MDELSESLGRSPELFPHELDVRNDSLTFIRLSRAEYASASFLDARILTPQTMRHTLPWRQVAASIGAAKLAERCSSYCISATSARPFCRASWAPIQARLGSASRWFYAT